MTYLVEHGADASARDGDGYTALGNAVRFGYAPIANVAARAQGRSERDRSYRLDAADVRGWADDADLAQPLLAQRRAT